MDEKQTSKEMKTRSGLMTMTASLVRSKARRRANFFLLVMLLLGF